MSGHRPGRHGPWRTRDEHPHPHLVAVRQADRGRYEVTLSPGAGVADLVAAAGILPPGVVYTTHRPATPEQPTAAILVFETPPADPPPGPSDLGGVPARPSPPGGPPRLPSRLVAVMDSDPAHDDVSATAEVHEAPTSFAGPALLATPGRHLVHTTLVHDDPDTPPTASDDTARHDQQAA